MNLGNGRDFLVKVVSQCLPYIGYPRSLNAITCINKAGGIAQKGRQSLKHTFAADLANGQR